MGVIPIVNENDTVATEEIKFGDNDRLAAQVALITEANLLILLSDIDGLYDKDPNINPDAKHLALIKEVTRKMLNMASQTTSENSKGGMVTKLEAAKIKINVEFYQSNIEGEIVTKIQDSRKLFNGMIINAAAFTHTSVAIRDALSLFKKPCIELHISNIHNRIMRYLSTNIHDKLPFKSGCKIFLKKNFKNLKTTALFNFCILPFTLFITNQECLNVSIYFALRNLSVIYLDQ